MMNSRCTSSPSLRAGWPEVRAGRGKGCGGETFAGLLEAGALVRVGTVMWGLSKYVFIFKNIVTPCGATTQPFMTSDGGLAVRLQSTSQWPAAAELTRSNYK
jgi:hypothetical protein